MSSFFVFDIDNTLIFTDSLNNEAYNHALFLAGLPHIENCSRITREVIKTRFPFLDKESLSKIICDKQLYCNSHADRTIINKKLLQFIKTLPPNQCIFWSNGDRSRIESLLNYHGIENYAKELLTIDKHNIEFCVLKLCEIFSCLPEELYIYEDDSEICNQLSKFSVNVYKI